VAENDKIKVEEVSNVEKIGDPLPPMYKIEIITSLLFNEVILENFIVSKHSDPFPSTGGVIGVLVLSCLPLLFDRRGEPIQSGCIHLKTAHNLNGVGTVHQQCFHDFSQEDSNNMILMGFAVSYGETGLPGLKLNSATFNLKLSHYLDQSHSREAVEFFTPILQTVMRKYKIETVVGFTLPVTHIPIKVFELYTRIYPNKHLKYTKGERSFTSDADFEAWCRMYFVHPYNRMQDFKSWFIRFNRLVQSGDLDFFEEFGIM